MVFYIENQENRFADRNAWRADGLRQLGQPGTTLSRCGAQPGGGWECWRPARKTSEKQKSAEYANVFPQSPTHRRGWKPHLRKFCDDCSKGSALLPGVRHLAAPKRMERGRDTLRNVRTFSESADAAFALPWRGLAATVRERRARSPIPGRRLAETEYLQASSS
jgi:hypothetical protein